MQRTANTGIGRRDFLAASAAIASAPAMVGLTTGVASGSSLITGLGTRRDRPREAARLAYWSASETIDDFDSICLLPPSKWVSPDEHDPLARLHSALRSAPGPLSGGHGASAEIRIAGSAMPPFSPLSWFDYSIDVLFDTVAGRIPVHALTMGQRAGFSSCGGGWMRAPAPGGRISIAVERGPSWHAKPGTPDSRLRRSVIGIPAMRGVYVVGWFDTLNGRFPNLRKHRVGLAGGGLQLINRADRPATFPHAAIIVDRVST